MALLRVRSLIPVLLAALLVPLWAQEDEVAPERASKPPVSVIFTPPDLEGRIVMGIFDDAGKLRRTLRFEPGAPELKIDTNGYIAQWDGLDDAGKPCPAGRYSAHGYVVGDDVKVEGVAFYFNDWMAEDQIPARDVRLRKWPDGVGVELQTAKGPVFEKIQADGALVAAMAPANPDGPEIVPPDLQPQPAGWSTGRDGTTWLILDLDGQHAVVQIGKDGASLRELRVPKDEPQPVEILASPTEDAILLKESGAGGLQRVRMLKRGQAATEKDGRVVADWEVVFERTFQPCANFGVVDGKLVADSGKAQQAWIITVSLVENALEPGKKRQLRLAAGPAHPGSAWFTGLEASSGMGPQIVGAGTQGGLAVVEISSEGDWNRLVIGADGTDKDFSVFQGDGVVVEEFRIKNLDHIAVFDAGTFLLAPAAE